MTALIEKSIIFLLCCTCIAQSSPGSVPFIAALLCTVSISCLVQAAASKAVQYVLAAIFIAAAFFSGSFVFFLPVLAYDITRYRLYPLGAVYFAALIADQLGSFEFYRLAFILILTAAAVCASIMNERTLRLERELITTRDNAVEKTNALISKNADLIRAQDNEVHLATLKERNRIAREIHDNVGHMLTRTILQMGAISIINKDEQLAEPLDSVKNTLDEAMTSIRKSVHGLHDDSIDLEGSLRDAIAPLGDSFTVSFDYDVPGRLNSRIKYCFIAIVKEAVNNIIKHSSGDRVSITVREHPAMCTLSIEDNGDCSHEKLTGGIGLENMHDRVDQLGGVLNISADKNGFKIFVSIMKKNGEDEK